MFYLVPSASGNVFHACVGIADLFITAGVLPIAATVLLSGVWDTIPVCQWLQFLTEASTYCYSMFFLVSTSHYYLISYFVANCESSDCLLERQSMMQY